MFDTILLAIDGSEPSNRATETAQEIAARLGAEVIVIHVREREVARAAVLMDAGDEEASELLDQTVRLFKDAGVSARAELRSTVFGRAPRVILETANETGADMVVIGSRGLSDLCGLVLGSVTHKVLHLAHCPVLVVR